jgi:hypothetical protein
MNIEEGLLTKLMEKLKEELQGMIRFELYRGLDRPEANCWSLSEPGVTSFSCFLQSSLTNTLYPKETSTVSEYLQKTSSMMQKFKFFKETGGFLLPSETFCTVSFLNDLLLGQKTLLHSSELVESGLLNELKNLSSLLFSLPSLTTFIPSHFTKTHHDAEFVCRVALVVDNSSVHKTLDQYKFYAEISGFTLPKMSFRFSFIPPVRVEVQGLWNTAGFVLESFNKIREHEAKVSKCVKQDLENRRIVEELVTKNTGEEVFDRLLETSC